MSMQGDWNCRSCRHLNFYWREGCRRCREPRPIGRHGDSGSQDNNNQIGISSRVPEFRPGDWFCNMVTCRAHNFASRWICFKCGTFKNELAFGGGGGFYGNMYRPMVFGFRARGGGRISRRGWKPGDWFCSRPGCNAHNYATRTKCYKCNSGGELVSNASG